MQPIDPRIFRAYDIRGVALTQVTADASRQIAHAYGTVLRERIPDRTPRLCVGRDARTHGPELEQAVIEGLVASGCDVFTIGPTPTPVGYFTICDTPFDGGIQVTASHNPAADNGLKLSLAHGHAYHGDDIQDLKKRIEEGRFLSGAGTVQAFDAVTPYLNYLKERFEGKLAGVKVVVDAGNGIGGPVGCQALRDAGAEVVELYTEPDGRFPNHQPDPSQKKTLKELQELVVQEKAHLGIAFDGDADRMGLVDEAGTIRSSDEIILLLAEDMLTRNPGAGVIYTASNSSLLDTEVKRLGGAPTMCKVGHANVEHAMQDTGALIGGELSGHFFFAENYFGFDDATMAALRATYIAKSAGTPLSQHLARFPAVFQAFERRPKVSDDAKWGIVESAKTHFTALYPVNTLDGVRIDFGEGAWAGIRASNTSPCISLVMEARTKEKLESMEKEVLEYLHGFPDIEWDKH